MKVAIILFGLFVLAASQQIVPIPPRADGLLIGPADGQYQIDMFIDLICPDCKAAWPIINKVLNRTQEYGVNLRVHFFPLPYHNAAFLMARLAHIVAKNSSNTATRAFVDYIFDIQADYYNGAIANFTQAEVINNITAQVARDLNGYNQTELLDGFNDQNTDQDTRVSWKYACSRGVTGTPTFMFNGVQVNAAGGFKYNDWLQFLSQQTGIQFEEQEDTTPSYFLQF